MSNDSTFYDRGAEAVISLKDGMIEKERIRKRYRIEQIDERIRRERTRAEVKLTAAARRLGIPTPIIYDIDDFSIIMQFIDGVPLRDIITPELSCRVGELIGRLHSGGIVHGDLTTSNMLLLPLSSSIASSSCSSTSSSSPKQELDKIYLIDFGLSYYSNEIESFGVDIHVLFQTYISTHADAGTLIDHFSTGYKSTFNNAKNVLKRVSEIEKRGRYA